MKNSIIAACVAAAASILSFASCNKASCLDAPCFPVADGLGTVSLSIDVDAPASRASDTNSQGNESAVTDVQVLIFDANGNVASYISAGTSLTPSARIKAGTYDCVAVINGPDLHMVKTRTALDAQEIELAAYNAVSSDFVMAGSTSGISVVKDGDASAKITASRFVGRVRLASVANNCPEALGSVVLKRAYISNVVGNQNLAGDEAASSYSNIYGLSAPADRSSFIDGAAHAAVPSDLTFADLASATLAYGASASPGNCFYTYPNPNEDVVKAWQAAWTPTATRLVLVAEVNGNEFFYPVAIPQLQRNTSYDVSMRITGEGLDDPQGDTSILADKGTLAVTIKVADWTSGAEYNVEY